MTTPIEPSDNEPQPIDRLRMLFSQYVIQAVHRGDYIKGVYDGWTNPEYPKEATSDDGRREYKPDDWYLTFDRRWFRLVPFLYRANTCIPLDKGEKKRLLELRREIIEKKKAERLAAEAHYRREQERLRWWP